MSVADAVGPELRDAARAIGLVGADDELNLQWFDNPLARIRRILVDPVQREALMDLLDALLGSRAAADDPEGWHPLLEHDPRGNLYVTLSQAPGETVLGLAGRLRSATGSPSASLDAKVGLVGIGGPSARAVAGTTSAPFEVDLRVQLDWELPAEPVGLRAISVKARLAPLDAAAPADFDVVLEDLQLAPETPVRNVSLREDDLGARTVELVVGLIRQTLHRLGAAPGSPGALLAQHLPAVLGLDAAAGVPPLPLAELVGDPAALRRWLHALVTPAGAATQPPVVAWLGHVAGLLGAATPTVAPAAGTEDDPWRVPIVRPVAGEPSAFELTLAAVAVGGEATPAVRLGARIVLVPAGATPPARVEAGVVIAAIPLSGTAPAAVLPRAWARVRAPGAPGATLASGAGFSAGRLHGGLRWDGSRLEPELELHGVTMDGRTYPVIDLTNADSVVAAASVAVRDAVAARLGDGPGRRLAALAALVAPQGDSSTPHLAQPATLAADPARAIAAAHRAALADSGGRWRHLFAELAALVGAGAVSGAGSAADPWRARLGPEGIAAVELAAWNAEPDAAAAVQRLRIGLRVSARRGPWRFQWIAEVLAFDLPLDAAGGVALVGAQHVRLGLEGVPVIDAGGGLSLRVDELRLRAEIAPGRTATAAAEITGLEVTAGGETVTAPRIAFPPPAGFDPRAPTPALGIPVGDLERLGRLLLSRAILSWGGMPGYVAAALAGLHGRLPGLPEGWPLLGAGAAGSLMGDPAAALRAWLDQVATGVAADGAPLAPEILRWLRALLADGLPDGPAQGPPPPGVRGSGAPEDPWTLPAAGAGGRAEALVWLEPAGPPRTWAAAPASAIAAAGDWVALLTAARGIAVLDADLRAALAGVDDAGAAQGLEALAAHLGEGDGLVPRTSQQPPGAGWATPAPIAAAHQHLPAGAQAIAVALDGMDAWAPAGGRAAILLAPGFLGTGTWDAFLAAHEARAAGTTHPDAAFDLRDPETDPAAVTVAAGVYRAILPDGDPAGGPALVERVVARVRALRPGARVVLVAHSSAALAARAWAAAHPGAAAGIVTLGAPHLGAPLVPVSDPGAAAAVRLARRLAGGDLSPGPLADALALLAHVLDGARPAAAPGAPPVPAPLPLAAFAGQPTLDTGGAPVLAIAGTLGTGLFTVLRAALAARAARAAASAPASATHVGAGLRVRPGAPAAPGEVAVDASVRADFLRVALRAGVPAPPRPVHALSFRAGLSRPGGWLAGGPAAGAGGAVRVRRAELGLDLAPGANGRVRATPYAALEDAGLRGRVAPQVTWSVDRAEAQALLGALLQQLSLPAPPPGTPLATLLDALDALGLAVPQAGGGRGVSADAFAALELDPSSIAPRVRAALGAPAGLLGLQGPPSGPWRLPLGASGLTAEVTADPWRLRVSGTARAGGFEAEADLALALPRFEAVGSLAARIGDARLRLAGPPLTARLEVEGWLDAPVPLVPVPSDAEVVELLTVLVPRLLISSGAAAVLEGALGGAIRMGPIDRLLRRPGAESGRALGSGDGSPDAARVRALVASVAQALGQPAAPELALPGGLRVRVGAGDPIPITLETTAPLGGVLELALGVDVDRARHLSPRGSLALRTPLSGGWPHVEVAFGLATEGVTLVVSPQGVAPIRVLPRFSGLGDLAEGAAALLPEALDRLVAALPQPRSRLATLSLELAASLGIWDASGGFAAHGDRLRALARGDWATVLDAAGRAAAAEAAAALLNDPASPLRALPGAASAAGGLLTWTLPLGGGSIAASAGWDSGGPAVRLRVADLRPAAAPVSVTLDAGVAAGASVAALSLRAHLEALGIGAAPELTATAGPAGFDLRALPLGAAGAAAVSIELAPAPALRTSPEAAARLAEAWLLPLAARLLLAAADGQLGRRLWTGGPTVEAVLRGAGILAGSPPALQPLPPLEALVAGALGALAGGAEVALGSLRLGPVTAGGRVGLALRGHHDVEAGPLQLSMRFGEGTAAEDWIADQRRGLTVTLLDGARVRPGLSLVGVGVVARGAGGGKLVDSEAFDLRAAGGYLFLELPDIGASARPSSFGGGLELAGIGLPLGEAGRAAGGGSNPVASSLLSSNGGSPGGDTQPVSPQVDLAVWAWGGPVRVRVAGRRETWIGVHRHFGPLYVDQVGVVVEEQPDPALGLLVDGGVDVQPLHIGVDDLGLRIPLRSALAPETWTLDLKGLAVSWNADPVRVAGGLAKVAGPPLRYDGMVSVEVAGRGFTAVGSYARPSDAAGAYTSLFVFVSLPIVLGGPPYLFVTGLGGGAGYNRELRVPEDFNQVERSLLVQAIESEALAENPMRALQDAGPQFPPKRGAMWLAAGLRFTSFVVVKTTAVAYVALDRGVEVGLLGVSRMVLPDEAAPLASVELALRARFSTVDGVLSIQAQLTDNSWLLSRDCQLTGGFAFFVWFNRAQFVLTLGGYHPAFQAPPEFPVVPRLGYHWQVGSAISIKGEAYFALTNSCVMAGGRMEATYRAGPIRVWFTAYADFLVSWDPFHYDISIGVTVGAAFEMEVCFIACATIRVSASLGAHLHIVGPPLHGDVTVDLAVASVTVAFGDPARAAPDYITDFSVFAERYLIAGDASRSAVSASVVRGLLPPEPTGAAPAPGTAEDPWKLAPEFAFRTETRMPAREAGYSGALVDRRDRTAELDLAPMNEIDVASSHAVLVRRRSDGEAIPPSLRLRAVERIELFPEATWNFQDEGAVEAAARTLPAIGGLTLTGSAQEKEASADIPIGTLVDDLLAYALPLPLEAPGAQRFDRLKAAGQAALELAATVGAEDANRAAEAILAGDAFAELRRETGMSAAGATPVSAAALSRRRSAPPLIAPLSSGLTMEPPALPAPPEVDRPDDVVPVALDVPRLRAELRDPAPPAREVPAARRTTVSGALAGRAPRTTPPAPAALPGARLDRVTERAVPRPTALAGAARALRSAETGFVAGLAHAGALGAAGNAALDGGVALAAGVTQIWELPGPGWSLTAAGDAGIRVTALDRAGRPLADVEAVGVEHLELPPRTASVAVGGLGTPPHGLHPKPRPGALTAAAAPYGALAATGWQLDSRLAQVSGSVLLGRGAAVVLAHACRVTRHGQRVAQALVPAAAAILGHAGVETWLPAATGTVLVLLDAHDVSAAERGDLGVVARGARLGPPQRVGDERRRGLLYDVEQVDDDAQHLVVAAASREGWQPSGIIGLPGDAAQWAARFAAGLPERLVADAAFSAEGSSILTLTYTTAKEAA